MLDKEKTTKQNHVFDEQNASLEQNVTEKMNEFVEPNAAGKMNIFETQAMFEDEDDTRTVYKNIYESKAAERTGFIMDDPSDQPLPRGIFRIAFRACTLVAVAAAGYWTVGMLDYSAFMNTITNTPQERIGLAAWGLMTAGVLLLGISILYQLLHYKTQPQSPIARQQLNYARILLLLSALLMLPAANFLYILLTILILLPTYLLTIPVKMMAVPVKTGLSETLK
jgi:hypothetical protein